MTIRETGVVDWLGRERESGRVLLTVVDDLDWANENDHLLTLQEKLNSYLAFIESGEVFERLVEEIGEEVPRSTPIKVSILAKFAPPERATAFLEHARTVFASAGYDLSFKVVRVQ